MRRWAAFNRNRRREKDCGKFFLINPMECAGGMFGRIRCKNKTALEAVPDGGRVLGMPGPMGTPARETAREKYRERSGEDTEVSGRITSFTEVPNMFYKYNKLNSILND